MISKNLLKRLTRLPARNVNQQKWDSSSQMKSLTAMTVNMNGEKLMSIKLYSYSVLEQSMDIRKYRVVSDKPLDEETIRKIYMYASELEGENDVSEYASELEGENVKATTTFRYTEFGDDCQVEVADLHLSQDFLKERFF
jgi:hypothetical protein